ncbi:hypothetical protein GUJ93_ZPchr0012g21641 [Zizania palustris]|uniref:Transcription initiation factor TFIID subunit 8 n=1 Tax=Zizania palustris TaxID=103762 RepID=A0A8J6BRG1_ZIZPA|nr:hypothetical protein GUJ93_ZPchr0012g21641 [Zizania palustris]
MSGGGGGSGSSISGDEFGRAVARAAVAQALEATGFDCAHRSAVDALVDVVLHYVVHLGRGAAFNANLAGRALANEYDIIQALEEIGTVGSGVVRDLMDYVQSSPEVPFVRPLPRFPVPRVEPQTTASFAVAGKESGMKHVPEWLPVFPDPHTYIRTEVWSEEAAKATVDKVEQVRQRRKAEKSLLSLQQLLAFAGADGFRPAVTEDIADKGKEIQVAWSKRNPFLERALLPGEKEVSEVSMQPERRKLSVLDAFAPAIQAASIMDIDTRTGRDNSRNQKSILPKERAPVHLKIGIDKKSIAAALNSKPLDLREDPSFLKEEVKDDRKRRAGMILRASMENPQELPQL